MGVTSSLEAPPAARSRCIVGDRWPEKQSEMGLNPWEKHARKGEIEKKKKKTEEAEGLLNGICEREGVREQRHYV